LIDGFFAKSKQIKAEILSKRNGFIVFPELNLLSTINMFSLSYNSGKAVEISMQDFWTGENVH
jgi:hypothetical protein